MGRMFKELFIILLAGLALLYMLADPLIVDLIPDIIPVVGWLDDGAAMTILVGALRHWGFDVTSIFGRESEKQKRLEDADARLSDGVVEVEQGNQKLRVPRHVLEEALRQDDFRRQQMR